MDASLTDEQQMLLETAAHVADRFGPPNPTLLPNDDDDAESWRALGATGLLARRDLARAWVELRSLQHQIQRTLSARVDGSTPGPEGSIDKLLVTRAEQLINHVNLQLRGASAVLDNGAHIESYFWSRAQSIFGGTQQIQRNIVAQRVHHGFRPRTGLA